MSGNTIWNKMMQNQILRFVFSSGLGFVVDISAFYFLYHLLFTRPQYHLYGDHYFGNYNVSFTVSFFLGVMVNFLADRYLVFTQSTLSPFKQFFRFFLVAIVGYFANLGVLNFYIRSLHINPPIARPAAALSLFVASFFVHKFFSFNLSLRHNDAPSGNKRSN